MLAAAAQQVAKCDYHTGSNRLQLLVTNINASIVSITHRWTPATLTCLRVIRAPAFWISVADGLEQGAVQKAHTCVPTRCGRSAEAAAQQNQALLKPCAQCTTLPLGCFNRSLQAGNHDAAMNSMGWWEHAVLWMMSSRLNHAVLYSIYG